MNPGHVMTNYISVYSIHDILEKVTKNEGTILMPATEIALDLGWICTLQGYRGNHYGSPWS
jgi:predicted enzyme related to lactoylglutathione lyase